MSEVQRFADALFGRLDRGDLIEWPPLWPKGFTEADREAVDDYLEAKLTPRPAKRAPQIAPTPPRPAKARTFDAKAIERARVATIQMNERKVRRYPRRDGSFGIWPDGIDTLDKEDQHLPGWNLNELLDGLPWIQARTHSAPLSPPLIIEERKPKKVRAATKPRPRRKGTPTRRGI